MTVACLCEPLAAVLKGLRRLAEFWCETGCSNLNCLVVGAGTIGYLSALIMSRLGCNVTVVDRARARLSSLSGTSIESCLSEDLKDHTRFSLIIEATGNPEALKKMLELSGAGTTLLLFGLRYGKQAFSFEEIVAYDKSVFGSVGSASEDFRESITALPDLDLSQLILNIFSLSNFDRAWEACRSQRILKPIIEVNATLG